MASSFYQVYSILFSWKILLFLPALTKMSIHEDLYWKIFSSMPNINKEFKISVTYENLLNSQDEIFTEN